MSKKEFIKHVKPEGKLKKWAHVEWK